MPDYHKTESVKTSLNRISVLFVLALVPVLAVSAQTNKKKGKKVVPTKTASAVSQPKQEPTPLPANIPGKKNERPDSVQGQTAKQTIGPGKTSEVDPPYFYEFTQPKFLITKITIRHDEKGKGDLTFYKGQFDDPITEPVQVSQATLEKINTTLSALDFLASTENYQYEKDYSHLGNITFRLKKDGREREVHFNYSSNKNALALADAYRRISNQIIWMFDMNVARENQPLDAPRLMDALQMYVERNEISDTRQMIPFLQELANDERIPLIARNHAGKLIKQIEKEKK